MAVGGVGMVPVNVEIDARGPAADSHNAQRRGLFRVEEPGALQAVSRGIRGLQKQPTTQPAQGSQGAAEKPATGPATPGIVASSELPPGSFWQVLAVKPEVAEAIRQTLKD